VDRSGPPRAAISRRPRPLIACVVFVTAPTDGVPVAEDPRPASYEASRGTQRPPATEMPWPPSPEEVETALRAYEVMVILEPSLEERTIEPSLDKYLNVIRNDGGTVESVDVWGRRRLAYEVKKNAEGIYAVITLKAEPATVKEFDRQLSLNESILRTKVMRPDAH
jgi:small subunit ribosomal protein S6